MIQFQIDKFQGPLALLLELIEGEKLDINEVSLAKVTEQYIKHVQSLPAIDPDELADFLVIAAKLIYLKSKTLLPNLRLEEEEGPSLEAQLRMYKEYVEAAKQIEELIRKKRFAFFREKMPTPEGFFPPKNLAASRLRDIMQSVLQGIQPLLALPKKAMARVISIKEKIEHIKNLIIVHATTSFRQVLRGAKGKTEVVVSFLALLELVKQKIVEAGQEKLFEDIQIKKI